jgi:hypothetical protein
MFLFADQGEEKTAGRKSLEGQDVPGLRRGKGLFRGFVPRCATASRRGSVRRASWLKCREERQKRESGWALYGELPNADAVMFDSRWRD